ncbi:MAG: TetR/AcrR family transcriptional regulator [Oscillospiraceae bacterium]|nr:TetR/AcrR family transcriptional regulator [Oscillospiraceae bacterium]
MNDTNKTKEIIFDAFVELTSVIGYEKVTVRDIAYKIGKNVASIYYHFENKASMLEYAYDYHAQHQYRNRRSTEYMKKLIESASAEEIVSEFMYTQQSEDQKHYIRMILIVKIIYMRIFQDPQANAAFSENYNNSMDFVTDVMRHGIEIGRIDPNFDIVTFADVLIGSMQIMGIKAFADVNYEVRQLDQEKRILDMISRILASAIIK